MKKPRILNLGQHLVPRITSSDYTTDISSVLIYNYANAELHFRQGPGEYKFIWNNDQIYYGMIVDLLVDDAFRLPKKEFFNNKIVQDLVENFDVVFIVSKLGLNSTSLFCFGFENKSDYLYWRLALD